MSGAIVSVGVGMIASKRASDKLQHAIDARKDAWDALYGNVEQNLADYYNNLTPDKLIAAGIQAEELGFAESKKQLITRLAQRGLGGGGLEADLIAKGEIGSAERRAEIRATAEETVREQQSIYLQGGEQEKSNITEQKARIAEQIAAAEQKSAMKLISVGAMAYGKKPTTLPAPNPVPKTKQQDTAGQRFDAVHNVGYEGFDFD